MTVKAEIDTRLAFLPELAEAARAITLPLFLNPEGIENKGTKADYDPVTKADKDAEKVLRDLILKAFPDDSIEGEEFADHSGTNKFAWTLDPIDGTRGFIAGVPAWSTLIALSYEDNPILGLIDVAALDKQYFGRLYNNKKEAWLLENGVSRPLKTANCAVLQDAILGCTEPLAMFKPGELAAYNIIRRGVQFSRLGLDALGYGLLSEGRINIIIEALMKPCDVRALMPIVEGAGGRLTNWEGGSAVNGGRVVAVSDAALLPELYTYLGRAMDPS
jgi:myo-inositol-1(or 4)-monophosphatase